jgi:hypothetical protein
MGLSPKKISSVLRPVKDNLGLRTLGINKMPCECDQVYIWQTDCPIIIMLKEHLEHHLYQLEV